MASRTELYQITRELRRYLTWQAQNGAPGSLPAPAAERELWQAAERKREALRAQAIRAELFGGDAKPERAPRLPNDRPQNTRPHEPRPAERRPEEQRQDAHTPQPGRVVPDAPPASRPTTPGPGSMAGSGGGIWNEFGSRPRRTFHNTEERASAPSDAHSSSGPRAATPERPRPEKRQPSRPESQPAEIPAPVSSSLSAPPPADDFDDWSAYDEQYIDYSEQFAEFGAPVHMPATLDSSGVVERVEKEQKPVRRAEMTNAEKLEFLQNYLGNCRRCALHRGRSNVVFGIGNPQARLMFVGESPGAAEDRTGEPFSGEVGALLDRMIAAMGFQRQDVYLASVVKCFSGENRNPVAGEVRECSPFLLKQIEAVRPEVIVALGGLAAGTLLGKDANLTQARGRWHTWKDIPVMPTYNPSMLLKNEKLKRDTWKDLQMVMARLADKK